MRSMLKARTVRRVLNGVLFRFVPLRKVMRREMHTPREAAEQRHQQELSGEVGVEGEEIKRAHVQARSLFQGGT
jgi:hypothetical protein